MADAIVNMIRAGAGLGDFHESDASELVQFAVRRGLLGYEEGAELLLEIQGVGGKKSRGKTRARKTIKKAPTSKPAGTIKKKSVPTATKAVKKVTAKKVTKTPKKKAVKSTTKKSKKKR